jgi:DNA mismatch repair protein MutS2
MAVLEVLTARGGCTLVTTHHGALKAFAHQHPEMENGSMEFDHQTLKPTYRFCLGVPGSSYAFHIANRLGMDPRVTSLAASHVGDKGRKVEDLIVQLHHSLQDSEEKRHSAEERDRRLKHLVAEYEEKVLAAQKEGAKIRQAAYGQADALLAKVNALMENAVAEIRRTQADSHTVKKVRAEIADVRDEVDQHLEEFKSEEGEEMEDASVGEEVWIPAFQARGTVLSGPDSGRRVLVLAGKATVQLPLSQLRSVQPGDEAPRHAKGWVRYSTERDISTESDVRGLTGDEACQAIEKYLDDAFVAGLGLVRIIHGKGTGALRQRIGQYLENHPRVKSKRLGDWNEGGAGVTVVELKQG